MPKLPALPAAAVLLLAAPVATPAGATIVTNGSFETGSFAGWTLAFDRLPAPIVIPTPLSGGPTDGQFHAAFLDGIATLDQTLVTEPGTRYTLSFDLARGGVPSAFGAFWNGGLLVTIGPTGVPFDYVSFSFVVLAGGSSTPIGFFFREESTGAWLIDNIVVTPIPEPATWAMMIAGFGMIGAAARRRHRLGMHRIA